MSISHRQRTFFLVSALALSMLVGGLAGARNLPLRESGKSPEVKPAALVPGTTQAALQHTRPLVDGLKTPELIPDDTAYMFFLRAVASSQNDPEGRRTRAYLKYAGVISGAASRRGNEQQIISILRRHSNEFVAQAAAFNARPSSSQAPGTVESRKEGRRALVARTLERLKAELPIETSDQIHTFVTERMKRRITIVQ